MLVRFTENQSFTLSTRVNDGDVVDVNTAAILRRKRKIKKELVAQAGGACIRCGYNKSVAALHFHHRDPATKKFNLAKMTSKSRADVNAEAAKCDLLCANCHYELEYTDL